MRPPPWHPPVDPSPAEQTILRLIKRAKLFVFLRQHRHELFDDAFQQELATIYKDSPFGQEPTSPVELPRLGGGFRTWSWNDVLGSAYLLSCEWRVSPTGTTVVG